MYINLLYLPLFNFEYLFFLSVPLNIFVSLIFMLYSPVVTLLQFCFPVCVQLVLFLTGRYNFWFPFFTGSIYCTLFLFDCFDFTYGYICIFSHTFYCCQKPLPLYWAFAVLWSFPFFLLYSFFFSIFNFLNLLYFFYLYIFVCLSYCSFPIAVNLQCIISSSTYM